MESRKPGAGIDYKVYLLGKSTTKQNRKRKKGKLRREKSSLPTPAQFVEFSHLWWQYFAKLQLLQNFLLVCFAKPKHALY